MTSAWPRFRLERGNRDWPVFLLLMLLAGFDTNHS